MKLMTDLTVYSSYLIRYSHAQSPYVNPSWGCSFMMELYIEMLYYMSSLQKNSPPVPKLLTSVVGQDTDGRKDERTEN